MDEVKEVLLQHHVSALKKVQQQISPHAQFPAAAECQ